MRPVRLRNYIFYLLALTITLPLLVLSYSQYRMIEQEIRKDDLLLVEDREFPAVSYSRRQEAR